MSEKEKLQKRLDLLIDKMRFWRYVIFADISSIIGMLYTYSQNKLILNNFVLFLMGAGVLLLMLSFKRLKSLSDDFDVYLTKLGEEK